MNVAQHDPTSLSAAVAAEVRAHLARQRISGRRAAMQLGWTAPYLSRRLTGEIPFNLDDLEAVAGLLGVPVDALFQPQPAYAVTPPAMMTGMRKPLISAPDWALAA